MGNSSETERWLGTQPLQYISDLRIVPSPNTYPKQYISNQSAHWHAQCRFNIIGELSRTRIAYFVIVKINRRTGLRSSCQQIRWVWLRFIPEDWVLSSSCTCMFSTNGSSGLNLVFVCQHNIIHRHIVGNWERGTGRTTNRIQTK